MSKPTFYGVFGFCALLIITVFTLMTRNGFSSTLMGNPIIQNYHRNLKNSSYTDLMFLRNSFYKQLNVAYKVKKTRVNLLVIVSSAPARFDRRANIRKTWWTECKDNFKKFVHCIFMTDNVSSDHKYYKQLQDEAKQFKDIEFQNLKGGVQFGVRMIYHMLHAQFNYEFDYFLRLDDDYFICANKLIYELPMPPLKLFHWGWVHTAYRDNMKRAEESVFMVSHDTIIAFLSQNVSKLMCHPWADQMIILWSDNLNLRHIYRHDDRLHHHPPVKYVKHSQDNKEICKTYIGVHGAYPEDMLKLWEHRGNEIPLNGDLKSHSVPVSINENFCWSCFEHPWQYEPKLCIENFKWDTRHQGSDSFAGRSQSI